MLKQVDSEDSDIGWRELCCMDFVHRSGRCWSEVLLPSTQFLKDDGNRILVDELRSGDVLQRPQQFVQVLSVIQRAENVRAIASLVIGDTNVKVTDDHRMMLQNGDYSCACDIQKGDLV